MGGAHEGWVPTMKWVPLFTFPILALLVGLGLYAAGVPWWAPAVVGVVLAVLQAYRDWRRRSEIPAYAEVKEYPQGCLCIRGAMLDNQHCPHHGNSYWSSRDH